MSNGNGIAWFAAPWRILCCLAVVACALGGIGSAATEGDFYPTFTNPYTGGHYMSAGSSYLATVMRNQAMRQAARQAAFAGLNACESGIPEQGSEHLRRSRPANREPTSSARFVARAAAKGAATESPRPRRRAAM